MKDDRLHLNENAVTATIQRTGVTGIVSTSNTDYKDISVQHAVILPAFIHHLTKQEPQLQNTSFTFNFTTAPVFGTSHTQIEATKTTIPIPETTIKDEDDLICPQTPQAVTRLYPFPRDCTKYYECSGSSKYIHSCPRGLHYNGAAEMCEEPTPLACKSTKANEMFPVRGQCDKYIVYNGNIAMYRSCVPGLHFNRRRQMCDFPDKAGCKSECLEADGIFPVTGHCDLYLMCNNSRATVLQCPANKYYNLQSHTCEPAEESPCNFKCKSPNGFFEYPGVCFMYIQCKKGIPTLAKCPPGLVFNPYEHQCVAAESSLCSQKCLLESGNFPVPSSCKLYTSCSSIKATVKQCPGNQTFSLLKGSCEITNCWTEELQCPASSGLFPVTGDCRAYIRCEQYVPTLYYCAGNLNFNVHLQACDLPETTYCATMCPTLKGSFPLRGDCGSFVKCRNGHPSLIKCSNGMHFNFLSGLCEHPTRARCMPPCVKPNGMTALLSHCDSYVQCNDGNPHVKTCSGGLVFDPDLKMCISDDTGSCFVPPEF